MLVGEQPGDQEDLAGRPFIGPAGVMLDKALAEARAPRVEIYITNAVKHFKYELRGKGRLHKSPNNDDLQACRWWFEQERRLVRPRVIMALGVTAARLVLGRKIVSLSTTRGQAEAAPDGSLVMATFHPSYLFRVADEDTKTAAYGDFVQDLKSAYGLAQSLAAKG